MKEVGFVFVYLARFELAAIDCPNQIDISLFSVKFQVYTMFLYCPPTRINDTQHATKK